MLHEREDALHEKPVGVALRVASAQEQVEDERVGEAGKLHDALVVSIERGMEDVVEA